MVYLAYGRSINESNVALCISIIFHGMTPIANLVLIVQLLWSYLDVCQQVWLVKNKQSQNRWLTGKNIEKAILNFKDNKKLQPYIVI